LFLTFFSSAQLTDDEKNYFFDDNTISSSKNIIKTDLVGFVQKEIVVLWEHSYAPKISFEAGVGILADGYSHSLWNKLLADNKFVMDGSGVSISLQNRFFYRKGFSSPYVHFGIKHRRFSQLTSTDYLTGLGMQYLVGNRIKVDFAFSLCWRRQNPKDDQTTAFEDFDNNTIDVPLSLKIGYLL
jgi:hypothetical protein